MDTTASVGETAKKGSIAQRSQRSPRGIGWVAEIFSEPGGFRGARDAREGRVILLLKCGKRWICGFNFFD